MGDVAEPGDVAGLHAADIGDAVIARRRSAGGGPAQAAQPAAGDHRQGGEVLGFGVAAIDPDGEILGLRLQGAGRQLDVLRVERALHVLDGQATSRHGVGVQPDAHGVELRPDHAHLGHAGNGRHPLDQVAVGVVGQRQLVHDAGGQGDEDQGLGVGVGLGDLRRIGLIGQIGRHPRDGVAHVVGGVIQTTVEGEGDVDLRAAVAAGRIDPVDPLDAGNLLLDDLGDALFHHFGGSAGIGGADRHLRRVDVGQLAHRQGGEGRDAHDTQDDRRHRRKDGPANGKVRKRHCPRRPPRPDPPPAPASRTGWLGEMRFTPSATMASVGPSPLLISIKPS